jgi:voltage-gated potassium channel
MGGELTAMLLSGEQITPEFVMQQVFQQTSIEPSSANPAKKS